MRNVLLPLTLAVLSVLNFSCTKESSVSLSSEQENQLVEYLDQVQFMIDAEDDNLNVTLSSFYRAQNADVCDVSNFNFITSQDLVDYTRSLGFLSERSLHDWMVDFGMHLRDVINDPYAESTEMEKVFFGIYTSVLENAGFGNYDESRSLGNNKCSVDMLSQFSYYAVIKANNYGIRSSNGVRIASNVELVNWGSSLHRAFDLVNELNSCE